MMALDLKGPLNLMGDLTLQASGGGKVTIGNNEILVEVAPGKSPPQGNAPPVTFPPPAPQNPFPDVNIINSFNKTVKIGSAPAVALGLVMQGKPAFWPGMMLPSQGNTPPVTASGLPINVVGDQAIIFPSGGSANFTDGGQ